MPLFLLENKEKQNCEHSRKYALYKLHDKVFFEAADAMYSSVAGSTLKNPAINVLFQGACIKDLKKCKQGTQHTI